MKRLVRVSSLAVLLLGLSLLATLLLPTTSEAGNRRPSCDGKKATLWKPNAKDEGEAYYLGTEGDDVIVGTKRGNTIYGLGGNDIICGGGGNDTLWAGSGNDVLHGQKGNDFLGGHFGTDLCDGGDGTDQAFEQVVGVDDCEHLISVEVFL